MAEVEILPKAQRRVPIRNDKAVPSDADRSVSARSGTSVLASSRG